MEQDRDGQRVAITARGVELKEASEQEPQLPGMLFLVRLQAAQVEKGLV